MKKMFFAPQIRVHQSKLRVLIFGVARHDRRVIMNITPNDIMKKNRTIKRNNILMYGHGKRARGTKQQTKTRNYDLLVLTIYNSLLSSSLPSSSIYTNSVTKVSRSDKNLFVGQYCVVNILPAPKCYISTGVEFSYPDY